MARDIKNEIVSYDLLLCIPRDEKENITTVADNAYLGVLEKNRYK